MFLLNKIVYFLVVFKALPAFGTVVKVGIQGVLKFPLTSTYSGIPERSCIRIFVRPHPCKFYCNQLSTDDVVYDHDHISIVDNTMNYKVTLNMSTELEYQISVKLFLRRCPSGIGSYADVSSGDFFSPLFYIFYPQRGMDNFIDIKMENYNNMALCDGKMCFKTQYCNVTSNTCECRNKNLCTAEDSEPMWLCGNNRVTYPNKCLFKEAVCGNPQLVMDYGGKCYQKRDEHLNIHTRLKFAIPPSPSTHGCMKFVLKEHCHGCKNPVKRSFAIQSFTDGKFSDKYQLDVKAMKDGFYSLQTTLNINWCEYSSEQLEMKHGDYYGGIIGFDMGRTLLGNGIFAQLDEYTSNDTCNKKLCSANEICVNQLRCECPPFACGDVFDGSRRVCANNGQTYQTECWMNASDCFSGTVFKVHNGPCGGNNERRDHYLINISVCAAVFFLAVVFAVLGVVLCKRAGKTRSIQVTPPYVAKSKYTILPSTFWNEEKPQTLLVEPVKEYK